MATDMVDSFKVNNSQKKSFRVEKHMELFGWPQFWIQRGLIFNVQDTAKE